MAEHTRIAPQSLDELHGYTPKQISEVFDTITERAQHLRDFLCRISPAADAEMQTNLDMAISTVSLIGAMADQMTGGQHVGRVVAWNTADLIESEVQHGK